MNIFFIFGLFFVIIGSTLYIIQVLESYGAKMIKLKKNPYNVVQKTFLENQELVNMNLESTDYTMIECACIGMQVVNSVNVKNNVTGRDNPMLAVMVQVAIPVDPRKLEGGLLTPEGLSTKFKEACPTAPTLKIMVNNEYVVSEYLPDDEKTQPIDLTKLLEDSVEDSK